MSSSASISLIQREDEVAGQCHTIAKLVGRSKRRNGGPIALIQSCEEAHMSRSEGVERAVPMNAKPPAAARSGRPSFAFKLF